MISFIFRADSITCTERRSLEQRGVNEDPVKFWAAMNMIYSDFVNVAKKLGISNVDFYTEMTRAFLDDKDVSGDKLAKYYEYVVK